MLRSHKTLVTILHKSQISSWCSPRKKWVILSASSRTSLQKKKKHIWKIPLILVDGGMFYSAISQIYNLVVSLKILGVCIGVCLVGTRFFMALSFDFIPSFGMWFPITNPSSFPSSGPFSSSTFYENLGKANLTYDLWQVFHLSFPWAGSWYYLRGGWNRLMAGCKIFVKILALAL